MSAPSAPALPPPQVEFRFYNSLDREYEATAKRFRALTFAVSRFQDVVQRIDFAEPVTEAAAVEAAERLLSQPLDAAWYERVKHDCFVNLGAGPCKTFEQLTALGYSTRSELLGDLTYLEKVVESKEEPGVFWLCCGS